MPYAGAILPPTITPLRKTIQNKPFNHIDTATYIELETESIDCKIYFSTDGTKPNPHQLRFAGRETTFRYKGSFTLKPGKRIVKAIAISRDRYHESPVVTKTFQVDDVGLPNDDSDDNLLNTGLSENETDTSSSSKASTKSKKNNKKSGRPRTDMLSGGSVPSQPFEAWAPNVSSTINPPSAFDMPTSNNNVQIPDGPFNPTNYSGTQINFWGVSPPINPASNGGISYPDRATQIGSMTSNMLRELEMAKQQQAMMKKAIEEAKKATPPPTPEPEPPKPQPEKEPLLTNKSPGEGDWKGQIKHIYAHLLEEAKNNPSFRTSVGKPKMGKIHTAELTEEDDVFLLTVAFTKPGQPIRTNKPKPPPPEPAMKKTAKTVANVTKVAKKLAPKKTAAEKPPTPPKTPSPPPPTPAPKEIEPYFQTEEYEMEGTLKPAVNFDSEKDAEKLRKAMKGLGTDEKAIINVLGYRSSTQRVEVVKTFKTMFGKDLKKELDGELSGNFLTCCLALCNSPDEYDASEIKRAVKGLGTDEDALVEILCTRTNAQIEAIKAAYKKLYSKEMEKDVASDTSGHFKRILVSQIQANRDESPTFDRNKATEDAQALYKAGEGKWGTDESCFNMILAQRSFPHLRAVFEEYNKISKKDIEEAIKSEFSGDLMQSLLTIVRCIKRKPALFAKQMNKAMKGLGTDDDCLVRVIVSRCECDMVQIKEEFQKAYGKSLAEWIKDDVSGDYRELLMALIGERQSDVAPEEEEPEEQEMEEVEEEVVPMDPTLKPADPFDVNKDCEVLRKAMKGLGTDEKAIIAVMGKRSAEQRQEIVKTFKTMYGKDLVKEFKGELSGNFEDVIVGLCQTPDEFDANQLKKAMKGLGTDEGALIEIICTRTNEEMKKIVETYKRLHGDLEKDIADDTSGHLKRLLVSLVQGNRPEGNTVNRTKARKDAAALLEAGEKKWGTDESRFNVILVSRSFPQLRATFEEYAKISKKDIEETIKSEMSGDLAKGMLTIVRCLKNKSAMFAKRLHDAMKGLGTDDNALVRVVISRCEVDMVQIKEEFQKAYNQSLAKFIEDDISGDYRKIILSLIEG